MSNLEKGPSHPRFGFPAAASFIASDLDHETYVFRKFNNLTARNLIHLQSELLDLQHQLEALDERTSAGDDPRFTLSLRHWEILKSSARDRDGDERKLLAVAGEIETKLNKYHQALLQAASIARLRPPSQRVTSVFEAKFKEMDIRGHSASMLDDTSDLVALNPPADGDLLSNIAREHWPFPVDKSSDHEHVAHFQERHLQVLVSSVSILISAVLLVGSIVTLYFVHDPDARLGLLILFILLFAVGIKISTSATRDSIFAATAAYAAVLVVFVSGDLGNSGSPVNANPGG